MGLGRGPAGRRLLQGSGQAGAGRRGDRLKYLCLIYSDEKKLAALPRAEWDAILNQYLALTDSLQQSGRFLAGESLEATASAATVRLRGEKISVTDGPFAETKEQLGGFCLIEAGDLTDALGVAARMPSARWGSIEVRPVVDF